MDKPIVSVIVLEYNNFGYIFKCLQSIVAQGYPNMEIIVNGDGGEMFNETLLINYFNLKRRPNVKKITINNNEVNLGTVRCCNQCVDMSSGKYYLLIAADDALHDPSVLSAYVDYYESVPENSAFAIGKVLMMDRNLNKTLFTFPNEKDEHLMHTLDSKGLFNIQAQRFFFGMTNVLPRSYYDTYGGYDEAYKLIEDVPYYVKAMCRGTKMHYLGIPTLIHRDGGISHGNLRNTSNTKRVYTEDTINTFEREFFPNSNLLTDEAKRVLQARYDKTKKLYYRDYIFPLKPAARKLIFTLTHPFMILLRPFAKFFVHRIGAISMRIVGALFFFGSICLLLYHFSEWKNLLAHPFGLWISLVIGYTGLIAIGAFALLLCAKFLRFFKYRFLQKPT